MRNSIRKTDKIKDRFQTGGIKAIKLQDNRAVKTGSPYQLKQSEGHPLTSDSPIQLTETGKWWGSTLGGIAGGIAGAAAGYYHGTLGAATGLVTGGIADAVSGYKHGGARGALIEGIGGAISGAFSGMASGMYHGGTVGMSLGSAAGEKFGDWWTGPEAPNLKQLGPIAQNMRTHLAELSTPAPQLQHQVASDKRVEKVSNDMTPNEIRLLNWMHHALGAQNFDKVAKGAQIRVPYDQQVFDGLISLGAQKRQSSHYSGTLFASGFRQVVGEQYGTAGKFLPTVLFGKIQNREGDFFMYFQPEGNAFNPDTGWKEKIRHVKDAANYVINSRQQGPHGESIHTDKNPITDFPYRPTVGDYSYHRYTDFKAFAANLLYTSGGSRLLSGMRMTSNEAQTAALEILTKVGLYALAYTVWKKTGMGGVADGVVKKIIG